MELINKNCLDVLPTFKADFFDLIVVNIPFGILNKENKNAEKFNKAFTQEELKKFCRNLKRIIKPTGSIIFFGRGIFTFNVISILEKEYQYSLIWKKGNRITGHLNASKQPLSNHEDIIIFQKDKEKDGKKKNIVSTYNPVMSEGNTRHASILSLSKAKSDDNCYGKQQNTQKEDTNLRFPTSILDFQPEQEQLIPGQKPLALIEHIVKIYSNKNDMVLDPMMKLDGTVGIACKNLSRDFIGIEENEEFFSGAKKRIENYVVTKNLLETFGF